MQFITNKHWWPYTAHQATAITAKRKVIITFNGISTKDLGFQKSISVQNQKKNQKKGPSLTAKTKQHHIIKHYYQYIHNDTFDQCRSKEFKQHCKMYNSAVILHSVPAENINKFEESMKNDRREAACIDKNLHRSNSGDQQMRNRQHTHFRKSPTPEESTGLKLCSELQPQDGKNKCGCSI